MITNPRWRWLASVYLVSLLSVHGAAGAVYQLTPADDWFRILSGDRLQPGDEVVLAGGEYRDARRLVMGHRGTPERPIVIRAVKGQRPVLHRPDDRQNTINIEGAQYLVLRGIEITGGSTGIRLMKSASSVCRFVTIEQMHIHHVGGPAVTANSPGNVYEGLVLRRNHIHHTSVHAEGFYLGVNNRPDGSTNGYIFNCMIEGNYIHDLKGRSVLQGDGIEVKDGSYNNVIRDNVIHDTNYPGIIVYGTDGKAPNIVERNVIWKSNDHGIQAAAHAVIRNNVVFDNRGDGVHSQPHQSARVGHLTIVHNTIVDRAGNRAAIRVSASAQSPLDGPVTIANNALFADGGNAIQLVLGPGSADRVTLAGNGGSGRLLGWKRTVPPDAWHGGQQLQRDLTDHFFLRPESALIGHAAAEFVTEDDFTGTPRHSDRDIGAYAWRRGRRPQWTITSGFKPLPSAD